MEQASAAALLASLKDAVVAAGKKEDPRRTRKRKPDKQLQPPKQKSRLQSRLESTPLKKTVDAGKPEEEISVSPTTIQTSKAQNDSDVDDVKASDVKDLTDKPVLTTVANPFKPRGVVRTVTLPSGQRIHQCEECKFTGTHAGVIRRHTLTHAPFDCPECLYSTQYPNILNRHMRIHVAKSCPHCDYTSTRTGDLNKHIFTHTGERPHQCPLCEYKSTHSGCLKRHMRTHTGVKPYKCDLCGYSTARSCNLNMHKMLHMGNRDFRCQLCTYNTESRAMLTKHVHRDHNS